MPLVVITGGLGCGKSTVLELLRTLGCRTADADVLAHDLYRRGSPLWQSLVGRWGQEILDSQQEIRRAQVADIVFDNPGERQWLEGQIHPAVQRQILELAGQAVSPLYCAIPLYYEAGWEIPEARIVCVWCQPGLQRQRLRQRGWDDREIDRRLACQLGQDEKLKRADFALVNNSSIEQLRRQCLELLNDIGHSPIQGPTE